jgi:HPt (histidine-containing phosphotransfer) domain-containing protein
MTEEKLAVVDMEFAMAQCMDDKEFLRELIDEMLLDEDKKLPELQRAIKEDDHKELQSIAHYIKGAAANIGLKALSDISTKLDALGKELKADKTERVSVSLSNA